MRNKIISFFIVMAMLVMNLPAVSAANIAGIKGWSVVLNGNCEGTAEIDYDIGVGLVWMGEEPAAVHDSCYILKHHQIPMYISYYLRSNIYHQQLKKYVSSGKISSFSAEGLGKVYIPIQSEDKQRQIASILDTFEIYISKLEKMIELRQKQYEYYREKLLTFE